ncbi:MAG: lipase family protein [Planctomycetota bacterium]
MQFLSKPLSGPIEQLSLLQRSLLFAELASLAYEEEASAAPVVKEINLIETLFVERDGAQAYVFGNEHDCIVACRGTEPTEMNDLRADVDATSVLAETVGRVHRGFKQEVDDLWPELEAQLIANRRTLWFAGHSLGGAMATICAGRCHLSHIESVPKELFTFGSPRVGNSRYVHHVALKHYRWVNNNDIVTRVPPAWMGYRHTGQVMYIDSDRKHRQMSKLKRARDRWRGFWKGLRRGEIDHLADHPMSGYIEGILSTLPPEERRSTS